VSEHDVRIKNIIIIAIIDDKLATVTSGAAGEKMQLLVVHILMTMMDL